MANGPVRGTSWSGLHGRLAESQFRWPDLVGRPSPVETTSSPECPAEELADDRHQLLAMATPPECPTDASQHRSLFTPLIAVELA